MVEPEYLKQKTMKTFKDFTHLNYQQISFFKSIPIVDAKWEIIDALRIKAKDVKVNAKGIPKVRMVDTAPVENIDFTIRSNSVLDGKNRLEYLINYYNRGVDMNQLKSYGENPTFIKKIKFVGKYQVLSEILNPEQIRKLQEIWLFANCYNKKEFSKEATNFIKSNDWAIEFLESKGVTEQEKK